VAVGLERLRQLSQELEARPAHDGVHRLLVDFRHTEWVSEEAHRELSRATRRDFGLNAENPALRVAFVLCGGKGAVSDSEHWFVSDADALAWLIGHSGSGGGCVQGGLLEKSRGFSSNLNARTAFLDDMETRSV
jgi:hypothetical protein